LNSLQRGEKTVPSQDQHHQKKMDHQSKDKEKTAVAPGLIKV